MGLILPIWKRKGDVHDRGKYRGITLLSHILKLLERVLDAMISMRVEGDFGGRTARLREGERKRRRDVRPETDGRVETGGTGQYGSGVRRPRESFRHSTLRYGDGDATVDGSTRSGSKGGREHVREDNSNSGSGRRSFGGV